MKCPERQTEAAKVGALRIYPEHGQLEKAHPVAPLRIFLSYGHDNNEELVRRIKADLEGRGHDVWFDKSEIRFGDDWRCSITEGIVGSDRVVSFLSKHSTRDPGVCRDEIAIAIGVKGGNIQTILVESEQEVQPPVNIGHIQWLDMHDWKEQRVAGEAVWEQWYQAKLAEIVRVVESDESRRFAGEIETLNGHLKPTTSEARICQMLSKGFYGRQWLFDAVEKWRKDTNLNSRLFWIMGAPGVGKSAFAAQLTHTRGDTVIAAQFCEWDKPDQRNATRVVRSLAFQLATRLPDYRKLLLTRPEITELDRKNPAELFDYLLAYPLRHAINGGRERCLIVIDALDEASEAGHNPLVEMLAKHAQHLPNWLGLVVTSRPEFDVRTPLQALNPFPIDTQSEPNLTDIRDYLQRELVPYFQNRPDAEWLVGQILERSEGVFLYVERFCDDVHCGNLSLDHPEQFPQGLGGIFLRYFRRQFPNEEEYEKVIEPALGAILAAREPLPVKTFQKLFGSSETQLRRLLRTLGSLFPVTSEAAHEVIKPCHKSLTDWLTAYSGETHDYIAGEYAVDLQAGHQALAETCWGEYEGRIEQMSSYAKRNLPIHLAKAQQWTRLATLLGEGRINYFHQWIDQGDGRAGQFVLEELIEHLELPDVVAAGISTQLARLYSLEGSYMESEKWLESARSKTSRWRGRRVHAIALHELGSIHSYRGDYQKAAECFRAALGLTKPRWFFSSSTDEAAANLVSLATVRIAQNRFFNALALSRHALRYAKSAGDVAHKVAALRLIGTAYLGLGNFTETEQQVNDAMELADRFGVVLEVARIWLLKGRLRFWQATLNEVEPSSAVAIFEYALEAAERTSNSYCRLASKMNLGWCAFALGETETGMKWFEDAERTLTDEVHQDLRVWCHLASGAFAHQRGHRIEAFDGYRRALKEAQEHGIDYWITKSLVGTGALHWHSGDTQSAEENWDDAQRISERISPAHGRFTRASIVICKSDVSAVPR